MGADGGVALAHRFVANVNLDEDEAHQTKCGERESIRYNIYMASIALYTIYGCGWWCSSRAPLRSQRPNAERKERIRHNMYG